MAHLMTTAEVAEILRCSTRTVTILCRTGDLAGVRTGGRWLVPASSVDAYLAALAASR